MRAYLELVRDVLEHGERRTDRTGTGTISLFGAQTRYDLREGFPLVTTKKVLFPAVVRELLWFLRGSTNINDDLTQHTPIWDAWADEHGELGPIYGYQWRNWGGADGRHRSDPAGDRHDQAAIRRRAGSSSARGTSADLPKMKLPPCHAFFQFYVAGRAGSTASSTSARRTSRSACRSTSRATRCCMAMIAQECELAPRYFVHTLGDAHIYLNHVEGVKIQLAREPLPLPRARARGQADARDDVRGHRARGLPAPPVHQVPGRGLIRAPSPCARARR